MHICADGIIFLQLAQLTKMNNKLLVMRSFLIVISETVAEIVAKFTQRTKAHTKEYLALYTARNRILSKSEFANQPTDKYGLSRNLLCLSRC